MISSIQDPSPSDVTASMIELAKLARRAGAASGEGLLAVEQELLAHLVLACHAQRGALLLFAPDEGSGPQPGGEPRLLALYDLSRQAVPPLLAAFDRSSHSSEQAVVAGTPWLAFRQPLVSEPEGSPLHFLLLLGWRAGETDEVVAQGQYLLPLLTDAIAAILLELVQAEHLHELESDVVRSSFATMDLFKAELLASVSHELRSPLASIKGYAATLLRHERRLPREERRQFLLAINEGTERLERSVDRLLEMSQLETGAITLTRMPLDMGRLAAEALRVAEEGVPAQLAEQFAFRLVLEDSAGQPVENVPLVEADARRMREVLDNLLDNAIAYSPVGGTITVVVRPVNAPWPPQRYKEEKYELSRPMLEVAVCDSGMGIAPEHLERIFERFYRVDLRLTREVNGLGLGLAMCKRIIELHGGAIWAESLPQGGSTFRLVLPLEPGDQAARASGNKEQQERSKFL